MKDYNKAYKAYDIRSVYNDPIDATFVYSLGKGIGKHLLQTAGKDASLVFGADVREANNEFVYRFLKGLEIGGCTQYVCAGIPVESVDENKVPLWGVVSTSLIYYFTKDDFDMGVMFTASHNPPEYVGMKIVNAQASLVPSHDLASLVEDYEPVSKEIDEEDFQRIWQKALGEENQFHKIIETKIQQLSDLYIQKFSQIEKKYKIVVDFSNGSAVAYEKLFLDEILKPLGHTLIYLCDKADSDFSVHTSDTTNPKEYAFLSKKVQELGADFGIMFDGDADRLGFVDEKGEMVGGDMIVALLVKSILGDQGTGKSIIYDITSTNAIREIAEQSGAQAFPSRVGHRFIKELFKKHQAVFGGELSGHLFFPEVGGFENPMLALYYIIKELQLHDTFSSMVSSACPYYKPPLVNYTVENKDDILKNIENHYKNIADLDFTDGIRVNFPDRRFLVRPSNTEPKLRFYIETKDKAMREEKVKEVEQFFKSSVN